MNHVDVRRSDRRFRRPLVGEREYRFEALPSRLALEYHRTFDDLHPAVSEPEEGDSIGAASGRSSTTSSCSVGTTGTTRRTSLWMLQNRLESIAGYHGADAAREEYDRIRDAWLDYEAELEAWLEEAPTGTMSASSAESRPDAARVSPTRPRRWPGPRRYRRVRTGRRRPGRTPRSRDSGRYRPHDRDR